MDAKASLQQKIARYFGQLTRGCGAVTCQNPYCKSNAACAERWSRLTANEAAVQAIKLAQDPSNYYCANGTVSSPAAVRKQQQQRGIRSSDVEAAAEECRRTNAATPLVRLVGAAFGSLDVLANSFEPLQPAVMQIDNAIPEIDLEDLQLAYQLLGKVGADQTMKQIVDVTVSALERACSELRRTALMLGPRHLRCLVICLESPYAVDFQYHRTLLHPLCSCLTLLSENNAKILSQYYTQRGADACRRLLTAINGTISMRVAIHEVEDLNEDAFISTATCAIGFLYKFCADKLIPYTEFYNELVCENMDFREDYIRLLRNEGFSFCRFPFLLNAEMKAHVLQVESLLEMRTHQRQLVFGPVMLQAPFLPLKVRREHLIEDSLTQLANHDPEDFKKELRIKFVGEDGIDHGGVQKEWFQLVMQRLFDPVYGMFTYNEKTRLYWFNSVSDSFADFKLIGLLLGLAIYNSVILDLHFPPVVYRKLLHMEPTLDDLHDTHPEMEHSFRQLLSWNGTAADFAATFHEMTFEASYMRWDTPVSCELKENGSKTQVTLENRQEFVYLYTKWLLVDSIAAQFNKFLEGFEYACDTPFMKEIRPLELELIICGSTVLDMHALESGAKYDNGYTPDDPTVRNFWEIVHSLPMEQHRKLLSFCTGSDRCPIGGLAKMSPPFVIARHGEDGERLPTAATCFNLLLLPPYADKERMRAKLLQAIDNTTGFGLA
eukprot:TRINITY_DN4087_c0_g1_i2.p1 TRINITY_DN4087_c0_g1~~TRINITY_DN4087_c0_g1_i2.p1  ORF type:complete len:735 (+),score=200.60 TRINITY_DN4087_c0_g1_i2:47-2206(+)